jgi:23S rRNA (pseudouridine1915-N3)-methyltransferase
MKLRFVFIGGQNENWLAELTEEYRKKIGFFCSVEILQIKPTKQSRSSSEQKRADETAALLKALGKKEDYVILCDERGDSLSSRKFSQRLVKSFETGKSRVSIVIGGAFGFSDEMRERADWIWSLSPLVFNHHIAQAVVLEQVYRGFTIWKNLPYHND